MLLLSLRFWDRRICLGDVMLVVMTIQKRKSPNSMPGWHIGEKESLKSWKRLKKCIRRWAQAPGCAKQRKWWADCNADYTIYRTSILEQKITTPAINLPAKDPWNVSTLYRMCTLLPARPAIFRSKMFQIFMYLTYTFYSSIQFSENFTILCQIHRSFQFE